MDVGHQQPPASSHQPPATGIKRFALTFTVKKQTPATAGHLLFSYQYTVTWHQPLTIHPMATLTPSSLQSHDTSNWPPGPAFDVHVYSHMTPATTHPYLHNSFQYTVTWLATHLFLVFLVHSHATPATGHQLSKFTVHSHVVIFKDNLRLNQRGQTPV